MLTISDYIYPVKCFSNHSVPCATDSNTSCYKLMGELIDEKEEVWSDDIVETFSVRVLRRHVNVLDLDFSRKVGRYLCKSISLHELFYNCINEK